MSTIIPIDITLHQTDETLAIVWSDGRTCVYPVSPLRVACPCVECRGGHEKMGIHNVPKDILKTVPPQPYAIEHLELVGNYALQIFWDDGHHNGLYTWDYLRHLCPSEERHAG
jgi:DUF971 family protein